MMPTTETKTKTKLRKGKVQSFSQKEVEDLITKAREEEAEKTRAEMTADEPNYFSDDTPSDDAPLFGDQSMFRAPVMDVQTDDMDDIFTHCEKHYHLKGKLVAYVIKKDGQFVGEQYHPFSWSKVQEKYGGGNFIIMAKDANTKTYIKQQTMLVQEAVGKKEPEQERVVIQQAPQPQQPSLDLNAVMELMSRIQMSAKSDDKALAREEAKSTTTIFTALMESQQRAQQQQADMLFKIQEQTSKLMQAQSENTNKLIETMRRDMMDILKQKPKEEFGFKELMLLQSNSRNEGFEQMKMIMEIAESKAEEKAEMLAGNDNDTGTIGKLIGAVVPLINATAKQMQPPQMPQQQMRRQLPPQQRRQAPQAQTFQRPNERGFNPNAPQQTQTQFNRPENSSINQASENLGDSFSIFAPVGVEEEETAPQITVIDAPPKSDDMTLDQLFARATPIQQRVAQEVIPVIASSMSLSPNIAAAQVIPALDAIGVELSLTKEQLLKEFTFELIWNIAKAFEIRDDKSHIWFKEFYDYVEKSAQSTTDGNSGRSEG